jgi:hypothetical protein
MILAKLLPFRQHALSLHIDLQRRLAGLQMKATVSGSRCFCVEECDGTLGVFLCL